VANAGANDEVQRPTDRLILLVVAVLSRATHAIPWPVLSALATVGGWLSMLLSTQRRRTVLGNVRHARADRPPSAIGAWAIGAQQIATHFRAVMATLRAGYRLPDTTDRLVIAGLDAVRPHLGRRGILIVSVHAGPYTMLGLMGRRWLAEQGFAGELAIVARMFRPFRSGALQVWFTDYFTRAGITIINVAEPPQVMAKRLRELLERNGIIVLLVDEPTPTPSAVVPFFDSGIKMPVGPVRLARATGAVIVPTVASYEPGGMMTITLAPPQEPTRSIEEGMHRLAKSLETMIARNLGQWGMLTPIWIDREGQPIPPAPEPGHAYAALHLHTQGSDGLLRPEEWLPTAEEAGIRVLAITDHDHIETVRAWKARDPEGTRHVIPGVELTARGRIVHLGVLFPEDVPSSLPPPDTPLLELVRWARGIEWSIVVLVHPLPGLWRRQLREMARADLLPDAIESRFPFVGRRRAAIERAAAHYGLAVLGGSDAHLAPGQIGQQATLFPGETVDDLVAAIRDRQTRAVSLPATVSIPRRVYALQSLYSWLFPFRALPGVPAIRGSLRTLARRAAAIDSQMMS
jgi:lauroyl/myristoyl acyltransferase/predicted metal-dependent phosphoesterase TrpH